MMCHKIGRPPISTIGFGFDVVSSLRRVPKPPANITAFIAEGVLVLRKKKTEYENPQNSWSPELTEL